MSNSGPDEVLVSVEGVTVEKSVDTEQFETLAVMFDFHVDQTGSVRVQLTDLIPEEIPIDDVGFHPDYGAEYWTIDDGRVVFEREFDAGEEYTTIYGVRDVADDDVELFLGEPELEVIDSEQPASVEEPAAAEVGQAAGGESPGGGDEFDELDDIVSRENSDVIRDVIAGDAEAMPGVESDESGEPVEATASADAEEPASPESAEPPEPAREAESAEEPVTAEPSGVDASIEGPEGEEADDEAMGEPEAMDVPEAAGGPAVQEEESSDIEAAAGSDAEGEGEITVPVTGGVARVLAKELREGTLRAEDQAVLREKLVETDESTDARIKHLQQKVSDLEAYTDALEAFLNEEGGAEEVIDEVTADMNEVREEMQGLRVDVGRVGDEMEDLRADLESMESETEARLSDIEAELDGIAEMVSELESGLATVEEDVGGLDSQVATLSTDVERLENTVSGLETDVAQLETDRQEDMADIDALESTVSSMETELESLQADRDRVTELEAEVDAVQSDLAEMASFRERLMNALGQGMGGGESSEDAGD